MKIIASDFDGTLRRYDRGEPYISDEDIAAIASFRKSGNLFGMCSGRALDSILKEDPRMPEADFYIVTTGAVIALKDGNKTQIIEERQIDRLTARRIVKQYADQKVIYVHMDGRLYRIGRKEAGEKAQIILDSFDQLEEGNIEGVSIGTDSVSTARRITEEIRALYRDVSVFQNNDYLDTVAKDCSKGSGIGWLRQYTGAGQIAGIGDSFNDIPLLDAADIAFTFHFSDEQVKAHADYIVESVAEAIAVFEEL